MAELESVKMDAVDLAPLSLHTVQIRVSIKYCILNINQDDSLLVKCIARARTFEETVIRALRAIAGRQVETSSFTKS